MTSEAWGALLHNGNGLAQAGRELLDLLPVAVYCTDIEGRITWFNAAAASLAGRTPEIGVDRWCIISKLFSPGGSPMPLDECPMAIALKGGVTGDSLHPAAESQCVGEKPDGTRFWFTPYSAVLKDAKGKPTGGLYVLVDVTSLKAGQNEAQRASLLLSAIVDSSDDAIISKDLSGTITSWNKSAEHLFGYTAEEIIGQPVTLLMPPDKLSEEPEIIERLKKGEGVDHFDTVRRTKDGSLLDISLTISPVRDVDGRIIGASKMIRNTTDTKRAERSSRLLSAIVDSSDDAIISKDLNGTITSWNKSAERLFGYTAEEIIGKPVTLLIPPDRLAEEPEIIARLKKGERVDHFETIRRKKDGTLLDISLTISPVRDVDGRIVGASKIARDTTERQRVEAEIRRVNRDLEQFAFSASHDLQEPLRGIKIYSELLARRYASKLDGQALEFLGYLQTGAIRMESLVKDLLAYTQVTRGEREPDIIDANSALAAVLDSLRSAIDESKADITSDPLPQLRIQAQHLHSLLQNLIGNAIKYRSKERTPAIHIGVERRGVEWLFAVRDNGIGIAPQYQENVFGLFQRLHTSEEYAGTGIGLAICQRIVAQYHGRIWVNSELDRGSIFFFTVPALPFVDA